jgi:Carboxypeptidase regulatory-like domain
LQESSVHTDADGKFELRGMPAGAHFDFLKSGLSDLRNQELKLDGGANAVTMQYGGALMGRVIDRTGKPIRNFRILLDFPRERRKDDRSEGFFAGYSGIGVRFTSADGSFVLTGVGADSIYRVRALADGHDEAILDRVKAVALNRLAKAVPATLRCGPPVSLRVRAVTSKGETVAGARVTLVDGNPNLDTSFYWGGGGWENTVRARTAKDGWADFPKLSFGTATALVQAPGHARRRLGWRKGEKELTVELPREAVLTGTIHDAAGGLLEKGYVNLNTEGDHLSATIRPDSKGRFRFTELPAGTWTITVRATDGLTELHNGQVTLKAGETKDLKIETQAP